MSSCSGAVVEILLHVQPTTWRSASGARRTGLYGSCNIGGEGGQEAGESGDDRQDIGGLNDLATVRLGDMGEGSSAYINLCSVLCFVCRVRVGSAYRMLCLILVAG